MPSPVTVQGGDVKAGPVTAPVIPLLLIGIGGYLAWFGVHYWRQDLKWPSDPVESVLQGQGLPPSTPPPPQSELLAAGVGQYSQDTSAAGGYQGSVPAGPAQNTAKLLISKYGWQPGQMGSLVKLWNQESGWSATARNQQSGAFGIAQALGHGGIGTGAPDGTNQYGAQYGLSDAEAQQANAGNARWQIEWGLGYIKDRYGTPDAAWAHEQGFNWY